MPTLSTTLSRSTTVCAASDLTIADLGGEAVLLDVNSGQYYGLNEVGLRVIELVKSPRRVEDILETLLQEYDVAPSVLERDVISFLESAAARHLIETSDSSSL